MIRKILALVGLLSAYGYWTGSNESKNPSEVCWKMYQSVCRYAEEQEIRLHIHTPECFLKKNKEG
ncbi:MAG: hypothetical protein AAGF04_03790 [Chlamydiota bacterium]